MHDPRIGRFFARDPLAGAYPHNSPYAFSENMVIHMIELEGLEAISFATEGATLTVLEGGGVASGMNPVTGLVVANVIIWTEATNRLLDYHSFEKQIEQSRKNLKERQPLYDAANKAFKDALEEYGPNAGLTIIEISELADLNSRSLSLSDFEKGRFTNLLKKLREGVQSHNVKQFGKDHALMLSKGISKEQVERLIANGIKTFRKSKDGVWSKSSYRQNLQMWTGKIGKGFDAHHTMPKSEDLSDFFKSKGIDVNHPENLIWRATKSHQGTNSSYHLKLWRDWVKANPDAEKADVLEQRDVIEKKVWGNTKGDTPKQ